MGQERSPRSRANWPMRKSTSPRYKPSAPVEVSMAECSGSSRRTFARPPKSSASANIVWPLRHNQLLAIKREYDSARRRTVAEWLKVAKASDIAPGEAKAVDVGARR